MLKIGRGGHFLFSTGESKSLLHYTMNFFKLCNFVNKKIKGYFPGLLFRDLKNKIDSWQTMLCNFLRGEIVAHGDQREEFRRRESGQLSVSLSNISEAHDILQKGDAVAIIDCFTFVPEFIPVIFFFAIFLLLLNTSSVPKKIPYIF